MNRHILRALLLACSGCAVMPAWGQDAVSGYAYLTPEMQEMQDDNFANPGMLTVEAGAALFSTPGANGKSCESCHGAHGSALDPKQIAHYPVYSDRLQKPVTLRARILQCRNERTAGPPLAYADEQALQLEAFVRRLALGETVNVDAGGPLAAHYEAGERLFHTRWGQVDIACHQCHDYHAGKTFRGQLLTQGQSNGFPVYRFTMGQVVGLQERISECLTKLRAEPYPVGSKEYTDLEVYMSARSNGLKIETPGIRY